MTVSLTKQFGITRAIVSPDAELIVIADKYVELRDAALQRIRQAAHYRAGSKAYNKLWAEALSTHRESDVLERRICQTEARTQAGALTKLRIAIEAIDADGTGCNGSIMDLPLTALQDASRLLSEEVRS